MCYFAEVTEKRVSMKEDGEGGTLEFIMVKSGWPLRHFSCIISIAQKKKMVRAKVSEWSCVSMSSLCSPELRSPCLVLIFQILVKLKFVPNPGVDVDDLSEQLETHVSDQFHSLQSTK